MKSICILVAVVGFVFASVAEAAPPDPNFYLFVCFGQSNMEGVNKIPDGEKAVDPRFQMLATMDFPDMHRTAGQWYNAVPPISRSKAGLCPVDYFGRTLVAGLPKQVRVGVIIVAVGGCKIELFDNDHFQPYLASAPQFVRNFSKPYGDNPYKRLVEMSKLAQQSGVIKGILLHQGESNTGDTQWPNKVTNVYENLLEDLDLKADNVPLLAGELATAEAGGACASMNTIIDQLPQTIPTAHVISAKGCPCAADHLHFTVDGQRTLGTRYGEAMLNLLKKS